MAYSGPSIKAVGALASGTAGITITLPAFDEGDRLILFVETANEAPVSAPVGWDLYDQQGVGTGGSNTASRIIIYTKEAIAGEPNPEVGDSGNHTAGVVIALSPSTLSISSKSNNGSTLSTVAFPDLTVAANSLVLALCVGVTDTLSTTNFDSWTNGFTEFLDAGTDQGNGGTVGGAYKQLEASGDVGATQTTQSPASASARMMISFNNILSTACGYGLGFSMGLS